MLIYFLCGDTLKFEAVIGTLGIGTSHESDLALVLCCTLTTIAYGYLGRYRAAEETTGHQRNSDSSFEKFSWRNSDLSEFVLPRHGFLHSPPLSAPQPYQIRPRTSIPCKILSYGSRIERTCCRIARLVRDSSRPFCVHWLSFLGTVQSCASGFGALDTGAHFIVLATVQISVLQIC